MARLIDSKTRLGLDAFLRRVRSEYDVEAAYLFGSRARGDHRDDSDADVALIMRDPAQATRQVALSLGELEFDVLLETGVLVSALPFSALQWANPSMLSNPLLLEAVKREGIAL